MPLLRTHVMTGNFWFSLLLGTGLAAVYVASSYISVRVALRKPQLFNLLVLGGMAVRLFLAVSIIAVVIAIVPVDIRTFLAAFFTVALIGMIFEVLKLHRTPGRPKNDSPAP